MPAHEASHCSEATRLRFSAAVVSVEHVIGLVVIRCISAQHGE